MEEEIMKKKYLFAVIIILMAAPRAWAVCDTLNLQASIVKAYFASESRSALRLATIDEQKLRLRGASQMPLGPCKYRKAWGHRCSRTARWAAR